MDALDGANKKDYTEWEYHIIRPDVNFMPSNAIDIDAIKVEEVMSTDFMTITKDTSIKEIRRIFLQNNFQTIPIIEDSQLAGVVAAFDFLKLFDVGEPFLYSKYEDKSIGQLEAIARKGAITVSPQDSLRKCIEYMSSFRTIHLPVVDKKRKIVGIISITDIMKYLLPE